MGKYTANSFAVLRVRDFRLLWLGQSISSFGDGIFTIALALTALRMGHGPADLAYVFAARSIPSVGLVLIGGVMADRFPRRTAMLTSDLVRGFAVGVVAVLLSRNSLRLWELLIMAVVFGAADALFSPASMAITPEIVSEHQLVQANALNQMSSQVTQGLIGPAVGGLIVGFVGYSWSMGIDAFSFGASALSLILMHVRGERRTSSRSVWAEAKEGIDFIRHRDWLLATMVAGSLANFFAWFPLGVLLPLLVRSILHGSASTLGTVLSAGGAAGLVATLVVARWGSPKKTVTVLWVAYAVGAVAIVLLGLSPNLWCVGFFSATQVGLFLYGDILWVSMMQKLIPHDVLGRVWSSAFLFSFALGPLSVLIAGGLATIVGARATIVGGGLVALALCVGVLYVPGVRLQRRNEASREQGSAAPTPP